MKKIVEIEKVYDVKGTSVKFLEKIAINEITGEEIFDELLEQENDLRIFNEYRKLKGLLLPEKIKEIRLDFGVTQMEFAKVLGLGDKTIARYENGSLQDMAQNNLIKAVEQDPVYFLNLLRNCQKLKEDISDENFTELLSKVNSKVELMIHFRLDLKKEDYPIKEYKEYLPTEISSFVLKKFDYTKTGEMISPLKIQKILNYIYSYCLTLFDYKIFEEPLQAWAHGPVFKSVYDKYSNYGYNNITIPRDDAFLHDSNLEKLIMKIAEGYGKYTAKELEKMTHRELPWKKARTRAGVCDGDSCNEKILDDDIKEYFKELLKK